MVNETQEILRSYFKAWTCRDSLTVKSKLSENLEFSFITNSIFTIKGRDAFLSGEAWPEDVNVKMLSEAYQDNIGFQMYEATNNNITLRVVEKFVIADGKIKSIEFITDQGSYEAFKGG